MTQGITRFRTSFTFQEGNVAAIMLQGRIVNVNMVNWTVDVVSQFDQKKYFDIQVGSPYQHPSNGEGLYIAPEVGAKCMVCLPSDSSPPYVAAFVMPLENTDVADPDSAAAPVVSGASFAGGRLRGKPGDIIMRTRDDNFVILHRGGVLQLGATELAQRIFVPLGNLVMDVSQNFAHHNAGGSILWGMQEGSPDSELPSEYCQTFRVFANEKSATVRIKAGHVSNPVPEPSGAKGSQDDIDTFGLGSEQILYEVAVIPEGFNADTGSLEKPSLKESTVLRFFFDKQGGTFFRCNGHLAVSTKRKLRLSAKEGMQFDTPKAMTFSAEDGVTMDGGAFTHVKGGVVRLGPGSQPVAVMGSMVQVTIPYTPVPTPGSPPLVLSGVIMTGSDKVLA